MTTPPAPTHRDLSGRPIRLGDYIGYAASWGRCPVIKYGKVVAMPVFEREMYPVDGGKTMVDVLKLQVVTVDRTWEKEWELQGTPWHPANRPKPPLDPSFATLVTLSFLDRLLVMEEHQVPEEARKLLDAAYEARTWCTEHDKRHDGQCPDCPKRKKRKK